ncbi:NAD(+) synthase [Photobacterium sp. SDRW27]|uniref:NAD(+) synthase n=1 Tax=Photobacterium obscurum TaxID=2829490 RepID=UPI0022436128|nr:NAD(+) synthase [Photobacterium obscurum]MCW8329888.1 NAD(+) synthase [Photobacterium obscurum]
MLDIDARKVVEEIKFYISKLADDQNKSCVVLGLSGGIDSAVLVTLIARSIGPERVKAYFLKDRDSEKESEVNARKMADWLGVDLKVQDISPVMEEKGIYTPLIMRLSTMAPSLNRFLLRMYLLIFRETPFISSLKAGCEHVQRNLLNRMIYKLLTVHLEKSFIARHIYRREVIEKAATDLNGLVLGAGNCSEFLVGWFVKGGIDDLPIQPMRGLYKSQIWQLAEYLELPLKIRRQVPSPDMMRGITDEFGIGMHYRRLDEILDYIDRGMNDSEIHACGVTDKEIKYVHDIRRFSDWKRSSSHIKPPVSGGAGSPFRCNENSINED